MKTRRWVKRGKPTAYGGMTQAEVAEVLGVTAARIGQIENAALAKLRAFLVSNENRFNRERSNG